MSVDEALKYIISMGVVAPPQAAHANRDRDDAPRAERAGVAAAPKGPVRCRSQKMRTTYCGLVSEALLGQTVTLWAGSIAAATTAA